MNLLAEFFSKHGYRSFEADKVDIIASALHKALTCNQFQVNETSGTDENIIGNIHNATKKRKHQDLHKDLSPVVQTTPRAKVR
ncbi:unnamed protein product [Microthlaspi erraticum]|uniref:Uncharacterized protein n=1 Tax=Microthlaspi erraticum TaxID=1685480 RepID=A0A6D2KKT0_9BRAS|nr:unnamed protein product [Microthlaspi erraticum]